MAMNRECLIGTVEDSYSAYYNIIKEGLPETLPVSFRAEFFKRDERYWLSKNIKIFGNDTNEYAFICSAPYFDVDTVKKCIDYALADSLPKVRPHKEHQYTNIKIVFIADEFAEEAIDAIRKAKYSKSYHMSLWGYSELLTCAVIPEIETVYTNRAGHDQKDYFKKLFAAEEKNRKKLSSC